MCVGGYRQLLTSVLYASSCVNCSCVGRQSLSRILLISNTYNTDRASGRQRPSVLATDAFDDTCAERFAR